MNWFLVFFFLSGFCSILYEIIWLRLAMAQFGVTTALVSIVLSMFMAGLGLGSWGSGRLIRKYGNRLRVPALRLYALAELSIGFSALLVPHELHLGRILLERTGLSSSWAYYLISGICVALTLIPWCAFMGATIPLGMLGIRNEFHNESPRSFSFLYLSNVLGALAGTTLPLLLIELIGFRGTLKIGGALNVLIAFSAMVLSLRPAATDASDSVANESSFTRPPMLLSRSNKPLLLLFATGITSMGMEVVWLRQFTPYVGTLVYSFASILGLYLLATSFGSQIYRLWDRGNEQEPILIWALLGLFALLPLAAANPEFHLFGLLRVAIGVMPVSGILGFVTPMLLDRWSGGDPDRAGSGYAINIIGCILGPLLAGFVLLPRMSERWALFLLSLAWLAVGMYPRFSSTSESVRAVPIWQRIGSYTFVLVAMALVFRSTAFEDQFVTRQVLRDSTATVVAAGEGTKRRLLVNGSGMTFLTPITKMMAHLPLAFLNHPPQDALVVCFGMGTTYRSLLSWGIPATAVELVPSVPSLFGYFHADGPALLRSSLSHVVIDDGRRYLERTSRQYDVITIDPPPPLAAAGSSLLYSEEFYGIVKRRLRPGGILQQWTYGKDPIVVASIARALKDSFPYVRVFPSLEGWGFHFLASDAPLPGRTAYQLVDRMPTHAISDMMEWGPGTTPERQFGLILDHELSLDKVIAQAPNVPPLKDDRPVNEYFLFR